MIEADDKGIVLRKGRYLFFIESHKIIGKYIGNIVVLKI